MKKLLHVADPTIGLSGLQLLSALWHAADNDAHLLILGHYDGIAAAKRTGIPAERILWHRSLGRFDPATFFGVAGAVNAVEPHAVGLWGNWAQHTGWAAVRRVPLCIDFIPPSQPYLSPAFYAHWLVPGRRAAVGFDRGEALVSGSTTLRYCVQGWCGRMTTDSAQTDNASPSGEGAATPHATALSAQSDEAEGSSARHSMPENPPQTGGPRILIITDAGPAVRVDIALWAAAIVEQIMPDVKVLMSLPTGYWGINRERQKRILEFVGDLANPELVSLEPETTPWQELAAGADVCVLAAEGPVILAPMLAAAAAGTPVIATATAQIQSAQPLAGLAATPPPNDPRLLAAAIVKILRQERPPRSEQMAAAESECKRRADQLASLMRGLWA
ncbi:MAG: hypothetical protein ACP5O1_06485 [Phycisphaerae bacterium]